MAPKALVLDNRYKIKKKLGAGGMASVFLADDLKQGFEVAIKILPPALADKPQYLVRFKREFDVCSKLDHPNVVKLFSCGETPDKASWYYAMEVLCCDDLQEILMEKTKLKPIFVLQAALQMARGFKHFHSRGVVHRDLKPANIMVEANGRVVIMDFGLVHDPSMTQLTKTGTVMGTPRYMSPELLKGWKVDPRSDIFQLGSIIHECLCGKSAFQGESIVELGGNILLGKYTPICTVDPSVPKEWEIFLSNCLVTNRDNRYQNADQVLKDLEKMMMKKSIELVKPPRKVSKAGASKSLEADSDETASLKTSRVGRSSRSLSSSGILKSSGISSSADLMKSSNFAKRPILESSLGDSEGAGFAGTEQSSSGLRGIFTAGRLGALGIFIVVLFLLNMVGTSTPKTQISVFRVFGGTKSGLFLWVSNQKCLKAVPKIYKCDKLTKSQTTEVEFFSYEPIISEVANSSGRVLYSHSLTVTDLEENSDFSVTLFSEEGGSESLPRSFSTKTVNPSETLELKENGDLHFVYESKAPFSCEDISSNLSFEGKPLDSEGNFFTSVRMVLPFKDVKADTSIAYKLETIDGHLVSCKKRVHQKLEDRFKLVFSQFMASRKVTVKESGVFVPFFDMWANDDSKNYIYDEYADTFAKITDESTRVELIDEFWNEVEKKLKSDSDWYNTLSPLLPGLPVVFGKTKISIKLRQSMANALLGLEIMQGSAVAARLPDNPRWISCIKYSSRPFPCTSQSTFKEIDVELRGRQAVALFEELKLPLYLIQDPVAPATYKKLKKAPLKEFHSEHFYNFELNNEPSEFSKAEIVVDLRTCGNPSMVALLNVNQGKFLATVRTTRASFMGLYDAWAKSGSYDGVLMMALSDKGNVLTGEHARPLTYGSREGAIRDYDKKIRTMHNALPKYEGTSIYHPLPLKALKRGLNKVKLTVLTGPSMAFDPYNYKTIRILLTR